MSYPYGPKRITRVTIEAEGNESFHGEIVTRLSATEPEQLASCEIGIERKDAVERPYFAKVTTKEELHGLWLNARERSIAHAIARDLRKLADKFDKAGAEL